MRQVDVVLSVLTLVAVGMGVAAYRAWHPGSIEPSADSLPSVLPPPVVVARRSTALIHGPHPALVRGVECRNGLLYWDTDQGVKPVEAMTRFPDAGRCEIHVSQRPAAEVSSADPSDQ